ncbi:MAG TPA: adenine phosphoribosyltransferase [Acidimicrobiia bacterium]|nr:adenine phosphoribosyltransferase [Acidimicrobiia bacterium]
MSSAFDPVALRSLIHDIPDFPKPGIVFRDITPLLADPTAFRAVIGEMAGRRLGSGVDKVLGVEARGFILAAPVALALDAGFVPIRKPGKLPSAIESEEYELEYGTDLLEIHRDAVSPGERVLIVDDVIATGGTAAAAVRLAERLGGRVVGVSVVIELGFLGGRAKLEGHDVVSLITYDEE